MTIRFYRIAFGVSLAFNVALVALIWLYLHFEATFSIVEDAVSFFY